MSNRVVVISTDHQVYADKVYVTHIPGDRKMQVDVAGLRLTMQQQQAVAATLSVRTDVRRASVSVGGRLNIEYNPGLLRGSALDAFVVNMTNVVKELIARKMADNS